MPFSGTILISASHNILFSYLFLIYGVDSELMHSSYTFKSGEFKLFEPIVIKLIFKVYLFSLVELHGINLFRLVNGYIKLKTSSL